jgi:hypothetical protein
VAVRSSVLAYCREQASVASDQTSSAALIAIRLA